LHPEVEQLMFKFGNCRRCAYNLKRKGIDRLSIIRQLREDSGIPARYVSTAYDTIKKLPPHVTFGGLKLQRLRETEKATREEQYTMRQIMAYKLPLNGVKYNELQSCKDHERRLVLVSTWVCTR
jgi:hypothetical protein